MALVVEDGSGVAGAESYITVAAASARIDNLGLGSSSGWDALSTTAQEQALRRAAVYMGQAYRQRWLGHRRYPSSPLPPYNISQGLDWPRVGVTVDDWPVLINVVPPEVMNANADLALKAISGDLNVDLTRATIREKVGPIETEYDRYSPQPVRYRAIDMMLAPYLKGGPAMASLVRT